MNILGINFFGHDTAAALVRDGRVLAAAEEERFTRAKHESSFPARAIAFCLDRGGLDVRGLDAVAVNFDPMEWIRGDLLAYSLEQFPGSLPLLRHKCGQLERFATYEQTLRELLGYAGPVRCYRHHLCHFASSYYLSGFDEAALLSMDGSGEYQTSLLGHGVNNTLSVLGERNLPHSVGYLYDAVSVYLGFHHKSGAGKVMGLASYGDPAPYRAAFEDIVHLDEAAGLYRLNLDYFEFQNQRDIWVSETFTERLGPRRDKDAPMDARHLDIAAALQERVEMIGLNAARHLAARTGSRRLCLAGGVALNCVMNGRILRETPFTELFVQPAAGDAGSAIGAALLGYHEFQGPSAQRHALDHTYLGPDYTDEDMAQALRDHKVAFRRVEDAPACAAAELAKGKILGWFQGRMEFGPRALGNRSILAAPFPAEMKDIINARVKFRESFRPFAPAVPQEDAGEYFDLSHESPYMLLVADALPANRERIAATVHVDGTGRVQTVRPGQNPRFHSLLTAFKKQTGVSVVLNTSFNVRGEPVVCSPADAVRCFLHTDIDVLILGDYVAEKTHNPSNNERN